MERHFIRVADVNAPIHRRLFEKYRQFYPQLVRAPARFKHVANVVLAMHV